MQLPKYKLELIPQSKEAFEVRHFASHCPSDLGQRFQIGGVPDFIQDEEWPRCKYCHKKMTFYAQLDAIGSSTEDFEIRLADCGLIYVFYCFDCNEAYSLVQSY